MKNLKIGLSALTVICSIALAPNVNAALLNGSFEVDDATGGPIACGGNPGTGITGWECFNNPFIVTGTFSPVAHEGSQVIDAQGRDAIVRQTVIVNSGDVVDASVWAMNWNTKPLTGIAIMLLYFFDDADNEIASSQVVASADGTQTITLEGKAGTDVSDWTQMQLSAVAPADAVNAQIFLLHVFAGGTTNSSVFFDDASLEVSSVPIPAAVWLFGSGLLGLIGMARRKANA